MGFFGVNFWSRDFLGILLEALRIFLGFDFCPHLIIPVTWNPEYPQPWGRWKLIQSCTLYMIQAWSYKPSQNWSISKKVLQIQMEKGFLFFLFEILESHLQSLPVKCPATVHGYLGWVWGGGGRLIDWWVTVPSARQCSSTSSIKAIIIICN